MEDRPAGEALVSRVGVVVIGKNEGERLSLCLASLVGRKGPDGSEPRVVYADSGSSDGSPEQARAKGAEVILLDNSAPHTAARGRNAGVDLLTSDGNAAHPEFVQFVDGDCELDPGWIDAAAAALAADPKAAIVTGHLVEKHRASSVYARLLNMEWQGPVGEVDACGGIFMVRVSAFRQVGGFVPGQAVGEEPDLCARLRGKGWSVMRINRAMGTHDAGMTRFPQWWKRTVRAGYFFAQRASAGSAERSLGSLKRLLGTAIWAVGLPLAVVLAALLLPRMWALLVTSGAVAMYGHLLLKVYRDRRRVGNSPSDSSLYALFCVLGKWPELLGQVKFWLSRPAPTHRPEAAHASR